MSQTRKRRSVLRDGGSCRLGNAKDVHVHVHVHPCTHRPRLLRTPHVPLFPFAPQGILPWKGSFNLGRFFIAVVVLSQYTKKDHLMGRSNR